MDDIADVVRGARKDAGLSQADLADRIYGTRKQQSAISRLERGDASPTVETLKKIADALDCELVIEFREED